MDEVEGLSWKYLVDKELTGNAKHWAADDTAHKERSDEEAQANAAFIVLAVNSHDALMDALKDARYALYGDGPGNPKIDAAIKAGEVKG